MESRPAITIVCVDDAEKSPDFLRYFLLALERWNLPAMRHVQVVVVSQRESAKDALQLAAQQSFPVDVVHARREVVDGRAVWDVMDSVRKVLGICLGEYLTIMHTEFIMYPGRLMKTVQYLRGEKPYLALGNLMRIGSREDSQAENWQTYRCNKEKSEALRKLMDEIDKYPHAASQMIERMDVIPWAYWVEKDLPASMKTCWREDVFFARREWLDAFSFFEWGGRKPFQDVYDLMGAAVKMLSKYRVGPIIHRMPLEVCQLAHLWHEKGWPWATEGMRQWFFDHADEWEGTRYIDPDSWHGLLSKSYDARRQSLVNFRQGPGGTVTMYMVGLSEWLGSKGGADRMWEFYQRNGRNGSGFK